MHAWSFPSKEQVSLGREAPPEEEQRGEGEGAKSALGNGDVAGKEQQLPAHSNQGGVRERKEG